MACGRPKNLEIAGRNPLCDCRDRRRNFFTTGNGNRRRGNPEPPARGKPRATRQRATPSHWQGEARRFGEEETLSHWCGGNPGPPGNGQLWGLWPRRSPAPSGKGETSSQPGKRENFKVYGGGETPSHLRRRKP